MLEQNMSYRSVLMPGLELTVAIEAVLTSSLVVMV